jgi:hypothetical protein
MVIRAEFVDATGMQYLDFEIEIAASAGADATVRVLRSPAGEAAGSLRWPYDREATGRRVEALQEALLRSHAAATALETPAATVKALGRALWAALITDDVLAAYEVSRDRAKQQRFGLRLKLRVLDPELATLPWEYLFDARRDAYPVLSASTPIVRYVPLQQAIEPLDVSPPLRLLAMVASPRGLPLLDTEGEMRRLEGAVEKLRARGLIDLVWVEGQRPQDLHSALQPSDYHIFHFIGHGGFDAGRGEGVVAFANEAGDAMRVTGSDLGILLGDHAPLRLAVLNACDSAKGGELDVFSSTAAALVRRGTPAVVAMQYRITDPAAIEFSRAFYTAVAAGKPVDAAVAEGRIGMILGLPGTVEWGTPVLSTRAPDGVLFRVDDDGPTDGEPSASNEQDEIGALPPLFPSLEPSRSGGEPATTEGEPSVHETSPVDEPSPVDGAAEDTEPPKPRWPRWAWIAAIVATVGVGVLVVRLLLPLPPTALTGRIAYASDDGIVVVAPDGSGPELVPGTGPGNSDPAWTRDGSSVSHTSPEGIVVSPVEDDGVSAQATDDGGDRNPAWAPDGTTLAFASTRDGGDFQVYILPADGQLRRVRETATEEHDPTWAPTGMSLAFASGKGEEREIVIWSQDSGFERMTNNTFNDVDPAWSPDGEWIAFASSQAGDLDIWRMRPNGTDAQQLTTGPAIDNDPTWSPDGRAIAFHRDDGSGTAQVWVLVLDTAEATQITDAAGGAKFPDWH